MEEVKSGRVEKLAILFERHHVMLFNFFLRLTGNRSSSEDLVQDVFFRILKYRESYQGQSKFTFWMYRIARNAHIDHLRKRKEELPLEEEWEGVSDTTTAPTDRLERDEEITLLNRALARMSPRKKEILLLSRFQDMKCREIAELLQCCVGTVKTSIHRAVKELSQNYFELLGRVSP
jgi:RNA polymerase sigma-70 factor (ECF subfamily)